MTKENKKILKWSLLTIALALTTPLLFMETGNNTLFGISILATLFTYIKWSIEYNKYFNKDE